MLWLIKSHKVTLTQANRVAAIWTAAVTKNVPNKIGYSVWHETNLFCTAMVLLFYENAFNTFIGSTEMGELLS